MNSLLVSVIIKSIYLFGSVRNVNTFILIFIAQASPSFQIPDMIIMSLPNRQCLGHMFILIWLRVLETGKPLGLGHRQK